MQPGEVLGIIGRNGAGKSTLLKILSRITKPTSGQVELRGRVGSLLEVGTGFHPELTGRENIYLNGTILGMRKSEIDRKFDEIVAFSEIERFLDTPVKHYSSGMYMRLAFAVAAHLEPEILIVDEVLAVGDAEFQKKCLGKMGEVARGGRAVLFVSHNMAALQRLCHSACLLHAGTVVTHGQTSCVIAQYTSSSHSNGSQLLETRLDRMGSGLLRLSQITVFDSHGRRVTELPTGTAAQICFRLHNCSREVFRHIMMAVGIDDELGTRIANLNTECTVWEPSPVGPSDAMIVLDIPRLPLMPGRYSLTTFLTNAGTILDWVRDAATLDVVVGDYFGTGRLPQAGQGRIIIDHSFHVRPE